ncbi:24278_t:CDS:2, partial [Gigaspora margarita]
LSHKDDFRNLWNTLDGKMKQLKQNGIIPQQHDPLNEEEISLILVIQMYQHHMLKVELFLQKWSQKNDQGELDNNGNTTSIPIPPDSLDKPRPIHDIQLYFSK